MGRHVSRAARAALLCSAITLGAGCRQAAPPRQFPLEGQVLAVHAERQEITIKHGDIEGLMPGMTMSFPVASVVMLKERTPGELVKATLELGDAGAKLISIQHTGTAPLPSSSEIALAEGVLAIGDPVPDAAFVDQTDKRRSFAEWKGTPTLVTFIYTSCPLPTFCPLMSQNLATIQRAIGEDPALAGKVKLVSITFDPQHDTPAVLAKHAARLKADPAVWTMLTGDQKTIEKFAAKFGVGLIQSPETPDQITHNLRTTLIGADGRVVQIYSGNEWTPSAVIADLRKIVRPS